MGKSQLNDFKIDNQIAVLEGIEQLSKSAVSCLLHSVSEGKIRLPKG